MSQVKVQGNASGTGVFTITSPNSSNTQTLTLPDTTGTLYVPGTTVSAIQSGTSQASTSGTSINFTGIPSWVRRITVMFNGVSTNGSSNVQIQIGSGSFTTSGYLGSSAIANNANQTVAGTFTTGLPVVVGGAAATLTYGAVQIFLLSGSTWVSSTSVGRSDAAVAGCGGGVSPALGGALDRIRITTVNGTDTFDAGSINILYE